MRSLVWVQRAVLVAALAARFALCRGTVERCADAVDAAQWRTAAFACAREYDRTRDPHTGALLAESLRLAGDPERAATLAEDLVRGDARADALSVLGRIALDRHELDAAAVALTEARRLHAGVPKKVARDEQALGGVQVRAGHFAEALATLDACTRDARAANAPRLEVFCGLSLARTLEDIGYLEAARRQLERAAEHADVRDRVAIDLELGNLEQDEGKDRQAIVAFERALAGAERQGLAAETLSAHLNLVYSLAETGDLDGAQRHLDATLHDPSDRDRADRLLPAGQIAFHRGDSASARELFARAFAASDDDDGRADLAVWRARTALLAGDRAEAERFARAGVELVEKVRAAQTAVELRPWVLSRRRAPYELLFSALAHGGRVEEAFVAFDRWQGRTLLDTLARAGNPDDLRAVGLETADLRALVPSLSRAPLVQPATPAELRADLEDVDAFALVEANGEIWRLSAHHGALDARLLGARAALAPLFAAFAAAPTDPILGDIAGALAIPPDFGPFSFEPLRVVLDGRFQALPVAALRIHGSRIVQRRPVIRSPRLAAPRCPLDLVDDQPVVISDTRGDLPAARAEGDHVAQALQTANLTGPAATSAALFAAGNASVLHVAVHATVGAAGGELPLADRTVSALQISSRGLAPTLVFLSACDSASASDLEGAGSLATAFLAGGARTVVATLAPVTDAGSFALVQRFYQVSGDRDPPGALAGAQAHATGDDWPKFAVFSVCR